jgi:large subunit ribosomal protein L24
MAAKGAPAKRTGSYPLRVRKGDQVVVIAGKDRGKRGRILRVDTARERVYVEGLNMVKRHLRPQPMPESQRQVLGGVIEREGPIHVSNVMLADPKDGRPTRVGVQRQAGGRVRIARRSGQTID